jgi:hypothetical protein
MHDYEVRPSKDHRGVDLISDALPFGRRHLAAGAIVNTDKQNFLFHRLLREL